MRIFSDYLKFRMMENGAHVIDIDAMLKGAEEHVTSECCVYRVPFDIRKLNEDAYTPKVVSIGPFHHNTHPRLHNMEIHKLSYCRAFLQRTQTTWDAWMRYIESVESRFRCCYSETLQFTKEELVTIIFVDSGFILELFYRSYDESWSKDLLTPLLWSSIRRDMLLLENQLPFFILNDLYNMSFASTSADTHNSSIPSFNELMFHYFDYYKRSELKFDNISICHFTDLLRTFHLQHSPQTPPSRTDDDTNRPCVPELSKGIEPVWYFPSATELSNAGMRFDIKNGSRGLLDLTFSRGVLRIPQLTVEDTTEILFRNMVALEQCHYNEESYVTEYVQIMDFLVNTSRDVDILIQEGVLLNWLGDNNSVAELFNGLGKNIVISNTTRYWLLCQDLNGFHRNHWNNLKSTVRHDYFKTPWQAAATIAGFILLILSLVQTVCSVLQVKQH